MGQSRVGVSIARTRARWWVEEGLTGRRSAREMGNLADDSDAKTEVEDRRVMQVQLKISTL